MQKGTKCDEYQRDPVSMVYKFFHEKSASLALSETFAKRATRDRYTFGDGIKNKNMSNQELAEELHKPIIWKFGKRKVHSSFKGNNFFSLYSYFVLNSYLI